MPAPSFPGWPTGDNLEISADTVAAALPAGGFRLIDCREDDEWRHCRIEGAELVPLSLFGQIWSERLPDPDECVVVYCHHGMRSGQAAHFLRQRGYPHVWSLAGGIEAWSCGIDAAVPRY